MRTVYKATDLLNHKETFIGNAKEIVLAMAQADFIAPEKDVWMYEIQERLWFAYGKKIKVVYGLYTAFLKELARVEIIKLERQEFDAENKPIWVEV